MNLKDNTFKDKDKSFNPYQSRKAGEMVNTNFAFFWMFCFNPYQPRKAGEIKLSILRF